MHTGKIILEYIVKLGLFAVVILLGVLSALAIKTNDVSPVESHEVSGTTETTEYNCKEENA